jgi:hypothetical protein
MSRGETALWHAVIELVVKDALGKGVTKIQQQQALNWFTDNRRDTFQYVCALAGLDPAAVRDRFFKYRERVMGENIDLKCKGKSPLTRLRTYDE